MLTFKSDGNRWIINISDMNSNTSKRSQTTKIRHFNFKTVHFEYFVI